ncbi:hypothetical protein Glove_415g38 [Diversispora epigaea]|uniref:UBX domain-containing protein n=1 Tax=Diversispora epigaea TaxID=1348612 RepID=A0A397H244_9GLOM|nr:hypothetical protein Glove_415g38 [Diversispora epigaea]
MEDESIEQFCSVTSANHDTAVSYLEMANGNVGQAITLYLETNDLGGSAALDTTNIDTDVEIAKQLAQEDNSGIRPPIAPIRDILVGGDRTDIDFGTRRTGITRPPPPRRVRNFANLEGEFSSNIASNDRLNELFNPPFDIMCHDNFERARTRARTDYKWLMVDIQNGHEFSSLLLNRDLWSDKTVREVIREHFLFLQYDSDSPNGRQYINFYPIDNYPHIAIIDPRTGERLKVWSSQISPTDFLMAVTDFLERYSLNEQMKQSPSRNIFEPTPNILEEPDAISSSSSPLDYNETQKIMIEDEEDITKSSKSSGSVFDSIRPVERDPVQGPDTTVVKFRLADGKTTLRRFGKSDPVRHLFEFIKSSVPEAEKQPFELVYYSDNLIEKVNMSIEEAGLSNAVVNMVFG